MTSRFHPGELAVQARGGAAADAAELGRGILAEIPPPAAAFLAEQSIIFVGHRDHHSAVWASVLHGAPGFASARDEHTVLLDAAPAAGDALGRSLARGPRAVGLLALEPGTRRRMRVNGTADLDARGRIVVQAVEVYSNCPKYIVRRVRKPGDLPAAGASRSDCARKLDVSQRELLAAADTFFIASSPPARGADVSHRGGSPGFLSATADGRHVTWPDYRGNRMFNTLGNLELDPHAGLLVVDWLRGDLLQIAGRARVDYSPQRAAAFPRAERVVDLEVDHVVVLPGALGGAWDLSS